MKAISAWCLVLLVSSSLLGPLAVQASCTPVVYLFRHAEDEMEVNDLTEVGDAHAELYPGMVNGFGAAQDYCPVGFVYALNDKKPDGSKGTINPRDTAMFLAITACYNRALATNTNQGVLCDEDGLKPRMTLANGQKLFEFLGATKSEQAANGATAAQFRAELINEATVGGGLSTTIFWTSEGLNVLGQAVTPGFKDIPGCTEASSTKCSKPKPPRNAVYVFEYSGSFPPSDSSAFIPTGRPDQYLQCFNVNPKKPTTPPVEANATYYCHVGLDGGGNLPDIKQLDGLLGKICDTTGLPFVRDNYFGPC